MIDNHSTYPEWWDRDPDPEWLRQRRGSPRVVSEAWGVPQARIERYLIPWKMGPLPGGDPDDWSCLDKSKAYATDEHTYGEWRQMYDFMAALGLPYPFWECRQHAIWLPEPKHWKRLARAVAPRGTSRRACCMPRPGATALRAMRDGRPPFRRGTRAARTSSRDAG